MAPPIWARPGEAYLEGWKEWINVLPARCARRRASDLRRSRTLLKKMTRAASEDDDLRAHLDCRRSRRLSPSLLSTGSDLGSLRKGGFPSIAKAEVSGGLGSVVEESLEKLLVSSSAIGAPGDVAKCIPASTSLPVTMEMGRALSSPVPALKKEAIILPSPLDSVVCTKEIAADCMTIADSAELLPGDLTVSVSCGSSTLLVADDGVPPLIPLLGDDTTICVGVGGLLPWPPEGSLTVSVVEAATGGGILGGVQSSCSYGGLLSGGCGMVPLGLVGSDGGGV
ncbi:hypothetical protein Dimus_010663 [Dionaea muscipula]